MIIKKFYKNGTWKIKENLLYARKIYRISLHYLAQCVVWCHNIQHIDTQHNDAQHKGLICDTQNSNTLVEFHYAECLYAECDLLLIVLLNVIMLSVVMLNVVAPCSFSYL
jgi:hypothetical protein